MQLVCAFLVVFFEWFIFPWKIVTFSRFSRQIRDGSWHQSRFLFQTQDTHHLPIVDVQGLVPSSPGDQRHLEVGPVCFLWNTEGLRLRTDPPVNRATEEQARLLLCFLCWVSGSDSLDGALPPSRTGARVQAHPATNKLYASTPTQTPASMQPPCFRNTA